MHSTPTNQNCVLDNLNSTLDATTQKFYCKVYVLQNHAVFMVEVSACYMHVIRMYTLPEYLSQERNAVAYLDNTSSTLEQENVDLIL